MPLVFRLFRCQPSVKSVKLLIPTCTFRRKTSRLTFRANYNFIFFKIIFTPVITNNKLSSYKFGGRADPTLQNFAYALWLWVDYRSSRQLVNKLKLQLHLSGIFLLSTVKYYSCMRCILSRFSIHIHLVISKEG